MKNGKILQSAFLMLVLLVPCVGFCGEISIEGGIWRFPSGVSNSTYVAQKLYDMDALARDSLAKAADMADWMLKEGVVEGVYMCDGEYLPLVLESMILSYRDDRKKNSKNTVDKARELLNKWAGKSRGKGYAAYKYLYHRIRDYHWRRREIEAMIDVQKEMILYDTEDYGQILSLMDFMRDYPGQCGDLKAFAEAFAKAGGVMDPEMELSFSLASLKRTEAVKAACLWLRENRFGDSDMLLRAMQKITAMMTVKDEEATREYYYALSDLALQQPATPERLAVFAAAMNERQKLQAAAGSEMPAIQCRKPGP